MESTPQQSEINLTPESTRGDLSTLVYNKKNDIKKNNNKTKNLYQVSKALILNSVIINE